MKKHRDRAATAAIGAIFLLGLALLLYPALSSWWNTVRQAKSIIDHSDSIARLKAEEQQRLRAAAEEFNGALLDRVSPYALPEELRWSIPAVSAPEAAQEGAPGTETAADAAAKLGDYSLLGMLSIPEAKLELPVMSEWSYPLLAAAPCRYSGSQAGGDLVILGHSYRTHFRGLRTIQPGAAVELTDAGGEIHRYRVAAVETVRGSDSAALASDWPLTLFTRTADRRHRVLVRCGNA